MSYYNLNYVHHTSTLGVQILYYIHDRYPPLSVSLLFIFSSLTPGVITQIPQMTTDLQRSTRFGDVNCQVFQP